MHVKDARSLSFYTNNRTQILQYMLSILNNLTLQTVKTQQQNKQYNILTLAGAEN